MDPAIFVAIIAGVSVVLLFFGLFGGRRVSPTERIEQVAGAAAEARNRSGEVATADPNRRGLRASIFGSRTASGLDRVVARRDWGANLAKELARADLTIRPSEYLTIRAGAIIVMHQGRPHSLRALEHVIVALKERGYTFVIPSDDRLRA